MLEETNIWVGAGRAQSKWKEEAVKILTTIYLKHTEYLTTGNMYVLRGIARGWGQVVRLPWEAEAKGREHEYFKLKKKRSFVLNKF